jgi:hypothetical protein
MNPDQFERIEASEQADFMLGTTRFDHHRIIPGEIVHTIRADNTPILYIIRPDARYQNDPFFAESPFRRSAQTRTQQSNRTGTDKSVGGTTGTATAPE